MRNKKFIWGAIILLISMLIVTILLFNHPKVEVMPVKRGDVISTVFAKGELESEDVIEIGSKMTGKIEKIFVNEGEIVKKGQIIGELGSDEIRANVEERRAELSSAKARLELLLAGARPEEIRKAESNLQAAEANLENVEKIYHRVRRLYEEKILSKEEMEKTQTQYKVAKFHYDAANEELKLLRKGPREEDIKLAEFDISRAQAFLYSAQTVLNETMIKTPISGMIIRKHMEPGETVAPGIPIFTIVDPTKMWVKIRVDGSNIGKIKEGQLANVILEAFPEMKFDAQVAKIAYEGDKVTEDFDVYVRINNHKDKILRSGMKADVNITVEGKKDVVLVPRTALFKGSSFYGVYIVKDSKSLLRKVKTGIWGDTAVEILKGVEAGERVITKDWGKIRDGEKITVIRKIYEGH